MTSGPEPKQDLRRRLRQQRRALDPAWRERASQAACSALLLSGLFSRSRHIAVYMASDGELDPESLVRAAWRSGKSVYLPVVTDKRALTFRPYRSGDRLHSNRYGIAEPGDQLPARSAQDLDLLLTPLVGFCSDGSRLGMGGGYYDRTLEHLSSRRPWLVGAGYACQQLDALARDRWDRSMDWIVTENGLMRC